MDITEAPQATGPQLLLRVDGRAAGLGPIVPELKDTYWRLDQDPASLAGIGRQTFPSQQEHEKVYDKYASSTLDDLLFTVYDLTGPKPAAAGVAGVDVNHRRRTGMFHIRLSPEHRGHGVGTEAARLVLDFAFHVTHLACVWLSVYEPNTRAIRAYEKAGFKRQGIQRNVACWLGKRCNAVLMDAVPEEFEGESVVARAVQSPPR
jgi:diamine N-acetyltransferase